MLRKNVRSPQAVARLDGDASESAASDPENERTFTLDAEWLEADGLGGFASGTVGGTRARRQHALLQVATTSPTRRCVLVNGFDAWVETPNGTFALTSQRYHPDVLHPDGVHRLERFSPEPWPQWCFALEDGTLIEQEIFARHGRPLVAIGWRLMQPRPDVHLLVRPFFSGRDPQALQRENAGFNFTPEVHGRFLHWKPYPDVPDIFLLSNSEYAHEPQWYRNFVYTDDAAEADAPELQVVEDLASPGVLAWDLSSVEAVLVLASEESAFEGHLRARGSFRALRAVELARRRHFPSPLHRAADAYVVRHARGKTVVDGYPWSTERGSEQFVALRGLLLASGQWEEALPMLLQWAETVSEGMLPDRYPTAGETPEFDSVDTSLWYVVAVHELMRAAAESGRALQHESESRLWEAVQAILGRYAEGTRLGIHADADGLLVTGKPGDTPIGVDAERACLEPRNGKLVDVQALWLNSLWIGSRVAERWQRLFERALVSFRSRFWNAERHCLYDIVDWDHQPGRVDARLRAEQIFAVGGLPLALLETGQARQLVETVEAELWTPLGLRALAPEDPGHTSPRAGGATSPASGGESGTAWPHLAAAFIEAWVRVRNSTPQAKSEARTRFLEPLLQHLAEAGIGHVSQCADAELPYTPRGRPFHACALGELLRVQQVVLGERQTPVTGTTAASTERGRIHTSDTAP